MTDYEKYLDRFINFLKSDAKRVLITGIDDNAKIHMVLNALNRKSSKGMIRCSELGRIADIINRAFVNSPFPRKVSGKKLYKVDNIELEFSKYIDSTVNYPIGDKLDFVLYYPIESVLMPGKKKYLNQLLNNIEYTVSRKTILITTNDPKKNLKILREIVDDHIHYDISNDNPELYKTVMKNLSGFEYPKIN